MTMWQVSIPGSGTHGVSTPHGQQFINLIHGGLLLPSSLLLNKNHSGMERRKMTIDFYKKSSQGQRL